MADSTLEDRILIRELYGRYALASVQRDKTGWLACWSPDAVWKTTIFEAAGQADLSANWDATWIHFQSISVFYEVGEIAVSGDTATAVSSVFEVLTTIAGDNTNMAGIYTDEFSRVHGRWTFSRRSYDLVSQSNPPVPA